MSCPRLIHCCGSDAEPISTPSTPPPRPSAVVAGRTSAAVPADVSLTSLHPANTPRSSTSQTPPTAQPSDTLTTQQKEFEELWLKAMAQVKVSNDGLDLYELMQTQANSHPADGDIAVTDLFITLRNEMKRVGLRGKLADMMEHIVPYLNRVMIVGDVAISANPNPAAFPWAAARFLLLNLTAGQDIRAKVIEGMAEMTILVYQCSIYQEVHLSPPEPNPHSTRGKLEDTIVESFVASIKFLCFALRRQRSTAKAVTDVWKIEDFTEYRKDLIAAKDRLHDAGQMCEIYRGSTSHGILKVMYEVVKKEAITMAEDRAKAQLKDLLVDPKDAIDHIYHPSNSLCLDGTRVAVLQDIKSWADDPKSPTVCWLPGLAGTGKSTIARTIARDLKGSYFGGAFFFKKGAGNRGNGRFLFSVIAYQLVANIPPLRQHIVNAVKQDDSSAVAPKDVQWRKLVQEPLDALQATGFDKPILLVIDALDECEEDDRGEILTLLASTTTLKVFITSRPELDIEGHFAKTRLHQEIVLHRVDPGTIEEDINSFIRHAITQFVVEYNRTHPQEYMQLQPNWPGKEKTQLLVLMSLPLFIAAATFIRMIKDRHWTRTPNDKISFIIETSEKAHSQYDSLYRPVLSLILTHSPEDDHEEITANFAAVIGSFILLADSLSVNSLAKLLNVEPHVVISQVDPLRSVIDVPSDDSPIRLFHLSFRDYLVSKSAGDLQVNETKTHETLAIKCFDLMKRKLKQDICNLGSPGTSRFDIDPETIQRCIPSEVQYACLYWVQHLKLSLDSPRDGNEEYCRKILSEFRDNLFLPWLEVLCLIGKVSDSAEMILELRNLPLADERAKSLQFCQDAMHFIRHFGDGIDRTPLQLYASGMLFTPKLSTAPQPFEHRRYPEWISGPRCVDQSWPQYQQMLDNYGGMVQDVIFLTNGRLVSVARDGRVGIWDPASGRCLQSRYLGLKNTLDLSLSSWKSSKIAIADGFLKKITIWDLDNSSCYSELLPKGAWASGPAFSDNGKLLCTSYYEDKTYTKAGPSVVLQIWDLETKECVREFLFWKTGEFKSLSKQGQWLACRRDENLIVSRWDKDQDFSWEILGEFGKWESAIFSTDGRLIASLSGLRDEVSPHLVQIWSLESRQCLYKSEIYARVIDLTSKTLAIMDDLSKITIIDLESGLVSHTLCRNTRAGRRGYIKISHDGDLLASWGLGGIRTWDLSTATLVDESDDHKMSVDLVALIADDKTVISSSSYEFKIWDIPSQVCKETSEISKQSLGFVGTFASAKCAPYFAIIVNRDYPTRWGLVSEIEIWQIAPLRLKRVIETEIKGKAKYLSISDAGQRLVVSGDREVELWDLVTFTRTGLLTFKNEIQHVVQSPDGSQLAFAIYESIEVWRLPGNQVLKICIDYLYIHVLAMHDQRIMCYDVNGLRVWDIKTGNLLLLWQHEVDNATPYLHESFLNLGSIAAPFDPDHAIFKPFYVNGGGDWVFKDGKRVLWLPLEYRPTTGRGTAIIAGSTIVIGSMTGRVWFLPFKN